ncbi:unnamed protein product [Dibothriocephalus latus]|uniref:Alpha-D-phosphohexomutase alpha/beta/alpha domain-containing protein n=1 Tax=Dibothriocephalus latus TaxID=60516 RepID=A0A3P7KYE9_DIBLA|nr:unnamed protein product [Dibothriocephalus latus]
MMPYLFSAPSYRYDYENMSSEEGNQIMRRLGSYMEDQKFVGRIYKTEHGMKFKVLKIENFSYNDPVDHSVSKNQGIMIFLDHDTRLVFRLSGTGSSGATMRMYVNTFSDDKSTLNMPASVSVICGTSPPFLTVFLVYPCVHCQLCFLLAACFFLFSPSNLLNWFNF